MKGIWHKTFPLKALMQGLYSMAVLLKSLKWSFPGNLLVTQASYELLFMVKYHPDYLCQLL